ncbi:MAG: heme o synthase [Verrucomicrobiales bacterium]|nr:heme o synthase [Verrucomicrobiales bacterium]
MASHETDSKPTEPVGLIKGIQNDLLALTKARLSVLVVYTAVFGYFVATKTSGTFSWLILWHTLVGTILAAFGASVFNQLMEVDTDKLMSRTSDRPLPSNRMPKPLAFILGWLLSAFGLIHLGVMVNVMAAAMGAATLITYLFIYTPMKRVSTFNTVVGAVSGALPPLIGWAGGGGALLSFGALFLFLLLFLWQMPHFAAINWMYREEYSKGGFKMWSNNDDSGAKTAKIAVFFSLLIVLFGILFPLLTPVLAIWGALPCGIPGVVMLLLALKFQRSGTREDARRLFFYTLLYLPLMMVFAYLAWL